MPRYFFHVEDGFFSTDLEGTELARLEDARTEAVRLSGAMLHDIGGAFWEESKPWRLHVTDEDHSLLFSLDFSAREPSVRTLFDLAGPS